MVPQRVDAGDREAPLRAGAAFDICARHDARSGISSRSSRRAAAQGSSSLAPQLRDRTRLRPGADVPGEKDTSALGFTARGASESQFALLRAPQAVDVGKEQMPPPPWRAIRRVARESSSAPARRARSTRRSVQELRTMPRSPRAASAARPTAPAAQPLFASDERREGPARAQGSVPRRPGARAPLHRREHALSATGSRGVEGTVGCSPRLAGAWPESMTTAW